MTPSDDTPKILPPELPSETSSLSGAQQLASALNAEQERRLHPLSWLYSILAGLQAFIIPIGFLWISGDSLEIFGNFMVPFIVAMVVLMIAGSVVRYLTYRFVIEAGEIRIRWGLFNKQVRHIPLNKIHNVSLKRNILHRLMDVAEVRLESAGSGRESEAVMSVLSLSDSLLLEEAIEQNAFKQGTFEQNASKRSNTEPDSSQNGMFHMKQSDLNTKNHLAPDCLASDAKQPSTSSQPALAQDKQATLLTLSNEDIVRYGLISNAGLAVGGILTFISNPEVIFQWLWQTLLPNPEVTMAWGLLVWLGLSIVALLSFVVLAKVISIITAYMSLYQFSLQDNAQYITIEKGLFTRNKSRMPLNKVQVWRIEETWLHRLFKYQRLLVDSAVLKGAKDAERGINELVPIAPPSDMQKLLKRWEKLDVSAFHFTPMHPKAWRRIWFSYVLNFSLLATPFAIAAVVMGVFNTLLTSEVTNAVTSSASSTASSTAADALDIQATMLGSGLLFQLSFILVIWMVVSLLLAIAAKKRAAFMGVATGTVPVFSNGNNNNNGDNNANGVDTDLNHGFDDNKHWLIWRDGWLTKKWIICEVAHCHGLQLNQSPFDRRYNMANLTVDTVGGTLFSARFNLLYLPMDKARQLQRYIREQVG